MPRVLLLLLAVLALPVQAALELKPFSASYTADWKQVPISGTAGRSLKALDNGRWELDFDQATKKVTGFENKDAVNVPLQSGMLDKSTYQLALQRDVAAGKKSMSYNVVEGTDVDTYDFRVIGPEKVQTKVGAIDAIKVERVRDPTQSKRITQMWFAKDQGGILVALRQVETDGKEYNIMLQDGKVDGKEVKGS